MSHIVPFMAYTKLFSSIVTSTIWMEDDKTRIVWITMLAVADKNGEVQGSIPGLARIAGVSVEDCRAAISKFLAPDPDSRTKDDEGRRIEEIDGGWVLLNYNKYRDMASKDEQREAEAKRKARYRERLKRNGLSQTVPDKSQDVPENRHIAEAEAEYKDTLSARARETALPGEPVLPTVQEVIEFAAMRGIPSDYARDYWAKKTEKHGWIANGKLIVWQSELPRWHSKDRTTQSVGKTTNKFPKRTQAELEADL